MLKPFYIYKSSAGSGKTYTLALEYLSLALSSKTHFSRILGVTFTNKATEEMKQRILKFLAALAKGQDAELEMVLIKKLKISEDELRVRSQYILTDILHNYSRFAIVTIDSFFHQVIRSFAREMGLQGTFTIELDTQVVLQQVIDDMLVSLNDEDKGQLKEWLISFAEDNVEDGRQWDIRKQIASLSKEIFKEGFKNHKDQSAVSNEELQTVKTEVDKIKYSFESAIKKICSGALQLITDNGLDIKSFKSGLNGPAGLFIKLQKLEFEISDKRRTVLDDIDSWITKSAKDRARLEDFLTNDLLPCYQELIQFFDENFRSYSSAVEVRRYLFSYGILNQVHHQLQHYREEHDVMLISDLPDFLRKIIADSDAPFIYEKVGSRFDHYLIDEFQDTSSFQWNNFKPLVKNAIDQGQFSMIVGDAKQSIYRFRGGDWRLLESGVKEEFGTELTEEINLNINWRSSPRIVKFNNQLFGDIHHLIQPYIQELEDRFNSLTLEMLSMFNNASQDLPKDRNDGTGYINISFVTDAEDKKEEAILRTISQVESLQDHGYELRDIAILTRRVSEGRLLAKAFIDYAASDLAKPNYKYEVVSKEALYLTSSKAIQFIMAVLKWMNDEKDLIQRTNWIAKFIKDIKQDKIEDHQIYASENWEAFVPKRFTERLPILKTLPIYELVDELISIFSLENLYAEYTYLQGFQDAILEFTKNERGDLSTFLEWWEEVRKERSILVADDNNAIKILTIHKSKGLEFPVVIIPFLDWPLDENAVGNKENILWCSSKNQSPYQNLPVVPLRYSKKLQDTFWSDEYYHEKINNLIDSLNMLYVALTRPQQALYIISQASDDGKMKTVGDVILEAVKEQEEFENAEYAIGDIAKQTKSQEAENERALRSYQSNDWRSKLGVQLNERFSSPEIMEGLDVHEELSKIKSRVDLKTFENHEHYKILNSTVSDLAEFFDDSWDVKTEVPLLLTNGDVVRIDRLNIKEGKTVVIDYKTGKERQADERQIRNYIAHIRDSGYTNVSGILYYIENHKSVLIN